MNSFKFINRFTKKILINLIIILNVFVIFYFVYICGIIRISKFFENINNLSRYTNGNILKSSRNITIRGLSESEFRVFSADVFELTKNVVIKQSPCEPNQTLIFTFTAAENTPQKNYYARRQFVRNSWVKEVNGNGLKHMFVLALPLNQSIQENLERESELYGDIIQFGFIDSWDNNTFKTIAIMDWVANNCLNTNYVIRTDCDTLVNVKRLRNMVNHREFKSGITGNLKVAGNTRVYVNGSLFNKKPFIHGPGFIMSTDVIRKLWNAINFYEGDYYILDDAFMGGIIAEISGVEIIGQHGNGLITNYCGHNPCYLHERLIIYDEGCENSQHDVLWENFKNISIDQCRAAGLNDVDWIAQFGKNL